MPREKRYATKPVNELQPGEYVLLGSFWLKVESVESGAMSKYQPDKQLAIIRGHRQRWVQDEQGLWVRSGDYDEPVVNDNSYTDSVHRYLPATGA